MDEVDLDNISLPTLNGKYALPLAEFELTFRQILEGVKDSQVSMTGPEDGSSKLIINYSDSTRFDDDNQIVKLLPEAQEHVLRDLNGEEGALLVGDEYVFSREFTLPLITQRFDRIDSLFHNAGSVTFTVYKNFTASMGFSIVMPNTREKATGMALAAAGNFSGNSGAATAPLHGFVSTFYNGPSINTVSLRFICTVSMEALNGGLFPDDAEISVSMSWEGLSPDAIVGDFSSALLQPEIASTRTAILGRMSGPGLNFDNPELSISYRNSYGLAMSMDLQYIRATRLQPQGDGDPEYLLLQGPITQQVHPVSFPQKTDKSWEEPAEGSIVANKSNSNLVDLIAFGPDYFEYEITLRTSPAQNPEREIGGDTSGRDYLLPGKGKLDIWFDLVLPGNIKFKDVEVEHLVPFNREAFASASEVELKFNINNAIPLSGEISLEVLGINREILYSIPSTFSIESPLIDKNLRSQEPRLHTSYFNLGTQGMSMVSIGSYLMFKISLSSPVSSNSREVYPEFSSEDSIEVRVGAKIKLDLSIDNFVQS